MRLKVACVDNGRRVIWPLSERNGMSETIPFPMAPPNSDPERITAQREVRRLMERAIDELPDAFRAVFVMRLVEEMSIEETASFLGLREETVKTRLHRASRRLRRFFVRRPPLERKETTMTTTERDQEIDHRLAPRLRK